MEIIHYQEYQECQLRLVCEKLDLVVATVQFPFDSGINGAWLHKITLFSCLLTIS